MLLAKTLRSTTFNLALVCIAIFGALVFALLSYRGRHSENLVRNRRIWCRRISSLAGWRRRRGGAPRSVAQSQDISLE